MALKPGTAGYVVLLAGFVMLAPVATDMYLASMPALADHFQTTAGAVQMTLGIYLFGFAIGNLMHGPLGDRFGRKPVILGGLALFVAASLVCLWAPTIEILTIGRFFQAIGGCAPGIMARAAIRDVYPPKQAPIVLAHLSTIMGVAPIAAPIIGGFLQSAFGWTSVFHAMTLFGLILALCVVKLFGETLNPSYRQHIRAGRISRNFATLLRHRAFVAHTLMAGFAFTGIFAFLSASPFVFQGMFNLTPDQFGLMFALVTVGYLSGTLICARLTTRLSTTALQKGGTRLIALSGCAMAALAFAGVHSIWAIAIPQFFFLAGIGIMLPHSLAGAIMPFPTMAGTASSLFGFLRLALSATGSAIMAAFMTSDPVPGAQTPLAVTVCVVGVLTMLTRGLVPPEDELLDDEEGATHTDPAARAL